MRVHLYLVLGSDTAEVTDISHSRYLFQARNDNPFMQIGQFAYIQLVAFQYITENLTCRRSQRVKSRYRIIRKFHIYQTFLYPLTGPVIVDTVIKHQYDCRKAESVFTSHHIQSRHTVHGPFDRDTDLLFNLFGGQARHLCYYLYGGIGNIRISIDRQLCP